MARLMTSMSSSSDRIAAGSTLLARLRCNFRALGVQPFMRGLALFKKTEAKAELPTDDAEEPFDESSDDGELRVLNKSPTRRTLPG